MLDESKFGRKDDKGVIEHTPTHSIVSGKRLPASGFATVSIGGGIFVRYTGSESFKVDDNFIASLKKSVRPIQKKKQANEGKGE